MVVVDAFESPTIVESLILGAHVALAPAHSNVNEVIASRASQVLLRGDHGPL
jgi:hypothetical protein